MRTPLSPGLRNSNQVCITLSSVLGVSEERVNFSCVALTPIAFAISLTLRFVHADFKDPNVNVWSVLSDALQSMFVRVSDMAEKAREKLIRYNADVR